MHVWKVHYWKKITITDWSERWRVILWLYPVVSPVSSEFPWTIHLLLFMPLCSTLSTLLQRPKTNKCIKSYLTLSVCEPKQIVFLVLCIVFSSWIHVSDNSSLAKWAYVHVIYNIFNHECNQIFYIDQYVLLINIKYLVTWICCRLCACAWPLYWTMRCSYWIEALHFNKTYNYKNVQN